MQHNISSSLGVCLSEDGFSLDELVIKLKELFETQAYGDILRHILLLSEAIHKLQIMQQHPSSIKCECGSNRLVLNGTQKRNINTSLGIVSFDRLSRVKCNACGKSFTLLLRYLKISSHQTKSGELEKLVLEQSASNSYRRANKAVFEMTGVRLRHTTFHNWVMHTNADYISVPADVIGTVPGEVFVDGTKCKAIGDDGKPRQGHIKVILGVNGSGEVYPIGSWTGNEPWSQISEEINRRKIKFPEGTILLSDAEPGLADALAAHFKEQQRCHWHLVRDTYHAMWRDGATHAKSKPIQDALKAVLAIELPSENFQKVAESEKDQIEERMETAEKQIQRLINYLREKGYDDAATYIQRSKKYLFGYVRRWLKLGISCPRASSLIERTMRKIARRVKNISYNWKSEGLGKIVKIVLKIFSQPAQWEEYWSKQMSMNQSVLLNFRIVKT